MKFLIAVPAAIALGAGVWFTCPCVRPCAVSAPGADEGGGVASSAVRSSVLPVAPAAGVAQARAGEAAEADDADEVVVALADVPARVLEAAKAALPGLEVVRAERETEGGVTVYCIVGTVNGGSWEVEVTSDGKVVEIENEDGEEDDDADER